VAPGSARRPAARAEADARRLATFVEGLVDYAVLLLDGDGTIRTANEGAAAILGHAAHDLVGQKLSVLYLPAEVAAGAPDRLLRQAQLGRVEEFGLRRRRDGSRFTADVIATPVRDGRGKLAGIGMILRDISALQASEARLQSLVDTVLDTLVDGLIIIDRQGRMQLYNRACERLFGYTAAETLGRNVKMLMPPEIAVEHDAYLENYERTGIRKIIGISREVTGQRRDGSTFPMHLAVGETSHNGEPIYVGIIRDLTERNRTEEQLAQAQKMESIGLLTGGIAHDFNNMLASVLGYSRLALQRFGDANPPKFGDYLREVIGAGERARDLVAQMLAFSRGEDAEVAEVEIPPLVDELLKLLRPSVASSIGISVDLAPGLPPVKANRVQLQQVLLNLCINARDAMGEVGHLAIAARRQHFDGADCASCLAEFEGDFVVISVGDDGAGIAAAAQERIFEPFYTTKPGHEGSGMGLAMVHGIVHRLGGHIGLLSAPGRGSTFSIALPELEAPAVTRAAELDTPARDAAWTVAAWPARVLVVDDEPAVAECTAEMLELAGFEASFETDPTAALARLERDPAAIDVLLTDQTMPRITGHQLAKAAMNLRPDLPVLLITGHSTAIDEASALACGIRAFLRKPVDHERLLGAVNAALPARPDGLSA